MLITPEMVQSARAKIAARRASLPVVLIEEEEHPHMAYVLAQLRAYLAELEAMTPLPPACSALALADHENWMASSDQISRTVRFAEWTALLTVPDEIAEVLNAIQERERALFNLPSA